VAGYRPMTLADLASRLARTAGGKVRWKLVWEFLEEYKHGVYLSARDLEAA
jgi:hypothetical protein